MRLPALAVIGPLTLALALGASVQAAAPAAAAPAAPAASLPASPHAAAAAASAVRARNRPKPVEHYVDINSASRKELMTLQGIGAAEAAKIVANRPYLTKTELVTKGVLQTGPYLSIKNQIVAMQKFDRKKVAAASAGQPAKPAGSASGAAAKPQ